MNCPSSSKDSMSGLQQDPPLSWNEKMTTHNDEDPPKNNPTKLIVHGEEIPLNAFVNKLFQKLVFAIVTSLHAPELTGKEKIRIEISK